MSPIGPTGVAIRAFRTRNGLTQAALAELLGVSKRSVEGWEKDAPAAPSYLAFALAYLDEHPEKIASAAAG